jgi:NAD(P)-dependent dehydrogenase (short-subunit alcohol dehydrogenase family)
MAAVVITGVSRGLGAALFDVCNARGDRILGVGRTFTEAQKAARDKRPNEINLHTTDLEDPRWLPDVDTLRPFLRDCADAVLIHNAAVIDPIGAVGRLPEQSIVKAVGVNFTAPMVLTNSFMRAAPTDARLRVLFISSSAAYRVIDGWALYCATKAGSEMFFNVLASQFAGDDRISVANVDPGQMDTGMQGDIRRAAGSRAFFPAQKRWLDAHAEGRLADPAEIANRIVKEHLY